MIVRPRIGLQSLVAAAAVLSNQLAVADFILGVDASYRPDMEKRGVHWKWEGSDKDLYRGLHKEGVGWLRVRLWTNESGVNGRDYTTALVTRALEAGLTPYLVLFLSPDWADLMHRADVESVLIVRREWRREADLAGI